jgi:cobalt/nickel transport system permease protein
MRHNFLDRYSRLNSPLHRLPAATKLFIAIGFVLMIVSIPIRLPGVHAVLACLLMGSMLVSRIPLSFFLGRLLLLETFTLGIGLLALLGTNGLSVFLSIMTKSTLSLMTIILLSNTTPFSELLEVLKRLRFPSLIITILALMYRYIFVLIDEMERMLRARESRSFGTTHLTRWTILASLVGQLFIRSTERAERIYAAMSARGWK